MSRELQRQRVLLAKETTYATLEAPTKMLQLTDFEFAPGAEFSEFKPMGARDAVIAAKHKDWTNWNFSSEILGWNDICYILACFYNAPTPTLGTSAYTWAFKRNAEIADVSNSLSMMRDDDGASISETATGNQVQSFNLNISRASVSMDGTLVGKKAVKSASPSAVSVSKVPAIPVLPQQVSVYFADTYAGLAGASEFDYGFEISISHGGKREGVWSLKSSLGTDFASLAEAEEDVSVSFTVAADSDALQFFTQEDSIGTKFMRVEMTGDNIDTGEDYKITVDVAFMINVAVSPGDEGGLINTYQFGARVVEDDTWGEGITIDVVNILSAL